MICLMHTAGLEVTLRHEYNSSFTETRSYQLPFMSELLHHLESIVHTEDTILPVWHLAGVQVEVTLDYISTNAITSVTNRRLTTPACVLDSNLVFFYDDSEILVPLQKVLSCTLTPLYKKSGSVFDHKKKKAWRNRRTCSLEAVNSV